ncbi:MAG: endo-1,4-beta-xylanase [Ruminococcus sp.]|nr:endo-1,4-beta-xylanase [Ruminococcus sp.]
MKSKKLYAAFTAAACLASSFAAMPQMFMPVYASEVVSDTFEMNYDGWHGNSENVILTAENAQGFGGSRGMTVKNRQNVSDGAASSKGLYLCGGVKYTYNMKVFSETDETFHLTLMYKDLNTDKETTVELATVKSKAGEWTDISKSYKAPENTYEYLLTLTTDSTNDFKFDEVTVTEKISTSTKAAVEGKGLKDEFANYFRVGNILNGGTVQNSAITANIIKDCNSVECENETKPDATLVQSQCSGTNIAVSLNSCAAIMDFCVKNNIGMRGHTLVWHSQTPGWFFKEGFNPNGAWVDKNTMNARMESYIKNMFAAIETQYPDLDLYAYDVCNECVSDDASRTANNGGAREPGDSSVQGQGGKSAWVQVYGDNSFVEQAFTYARKYAPDGCALYYNDYNEYWDHKRDTIYNMCKSLYEKGLLDGIGMQSHVPANATGFAGTDSYIEAMYKYLSIGCDVQVTELDISVESGKYSYTDQANKYKAIFQAAMDWNTNPKSDGRVTAVCIWGPNDANSWLSEGSNALLYDSSNQPKEAYKTLINMLPDSEWGDGSNYSGGEIKKQEPNDYGWYFQCGFEGSLDNWSARGSSKIQTSGRTAYVGDEALLVQDRTASWNGASYPISTRAFIPGETYSFSANVEYFDGAENDTFMMKLQYTNAEGDTCYDEIASAAVPKGQWVQLANTGYTIPADASNMSIYIETAANDDEVYNNFYIDEVIGAVGGTGILGAGQPDIKEISVGDVDFDGTISVFDLIAARKGFIDGFADDNAKKAADADQSGKVEVNDLVLLQNYLLGKINAFPTAEKTVDTAALEKLFSSVTIAESWKNDGENNPLTTQRFGADPGWLVYDGRLYIYTTNDAFEYNSNGQIKVNSYDSGTINCVSTADMVNWTDHGAIPAADGNGRTTNGAAKWAFAAWAPDACWKMIDGKPKFFLYFANSGGGIGVLTADSPTGPWSDPLGHALIDRSTPNCSNVAWLFDPGVYYDEATDEAYLVFGGGKNDGTGYDNPKTGRIVRLGKDMISLDGTPQTMETPYLFEDSSIIKIGDTWYYSYCTNWNVPGGTNINGVSFGSADICYMTSKNPLGSWNGSNLKGMVFGNTGSQRIDNGGNNHHSIIYFKDRYYVAYHSRQQALRMEVNALENNGNINKDGNYRSTQINECSFDASTGKLSCSGDMKGAKQIESLDVYKKVQAETMSNQSKGISVNGLYDTTVKGGKGDWIKVSGADLGKGISNITVKGKGGTVKFCSGSPKGDVIGYAELEGSMKEITVPSVSSVSGKQDIYLVFSGDTELDYWYFS